MEQMERVGVSRELYNDSRVATGGRAGGFASPGHVFFAITMFGLGIVGFVRPPYASTWAAVAATSPAYGALGVCAAVVSLVTGAGLLWRRSAAIASRVLLGAFVVWIIAFRLPLLIKYPVSTGGWWPIADTSVMTGAAWVLYLWFAGERDLTRFPFATGDKGLRYARTLYGLGLIPFGIAHFAFWARTVSLVPGWLPFHTAWAGFTGAAFIGAGLGIVFGVKARLAAILSTWEMALFTVLVWVPVIVSGRATAGDWTEFIGSWVVAAAGWVVAESYGTGGRTAGANGGE